MKYTSVNREISAYWKRHKKELTIKIIEHNPELKSFKDKDLYTLFKQDVRAFIKEKKLTTKQAIKAELRTRAFKSQEEFYQEGITSNLMSDKERRESLKNFFRDRGKYSKINAPQYLGKVEIDNLSYSKYEYKNKKGEKMYAYEADSPKSKKYDLMLTKENYE